MRPETNRAVVIRRGGSKVFCTIAWDLASDTFEVGQWCKHKIYPRRSDISSDGQWLVYFALNGRWRSDTRGSFTAVSYAPYLKALWLWPQGDTWGGGGLFYRDAAQMPDRIRSVFASLWAPPGRDRLYFGDYLNRLDRDGWQQTRDGLVKEIGRGLRLRKIVRSEPSGERHQLLGTDGTTTDLSRWEWAEYDAPRKRVVWAEAGILRAATPHADGLGDPRALFDARAMSFAALKAPYDVETKLMK
jgi:hypothetical protein